MAVFVLNRTGKSNDSGRSSFELLTKKSFEIHQLKGTLAHQYTYTFKRKREENETVKVKKYLWSATDKM